MSAEDRTVHGRGTAHDGGQYEVVRYDRGGKWWIEFTDGRRRPVSLAEAVVAADVALLRRPGGRAFDARWRKK